MTKMTSKAGTLRTECRECGAQILAGVYVEEWDANMNPYVAPGLHPAGARVTIEVQSLGCDCYESDEVKAWIEDAVSPEMDGLTWDGGAS